MNPWVSRLLGIVGAFTGTFGAFWLLLAFTTQINGRPIAVEDPSWLLVGVVPLSVTGIIIYWTNWRHPRE